MTKVRLVDIARQAGVGTATVERVLNARGNTRPETAQKVLLTARALGYDRHLPEPYKGLVRIEVVMVRPDTPFFARLNRAFSRIAATLDPVVILHRTFLDEADPHGLARHIADPGFRRAGLIIVGPDHPVVRARLREARQSGVAVTTIVSRIDDGDEAFVGIDNYAAGRTAGFYMESMLRTRAGRLVAFCHSGVYSVHKERIRGFSTFLAEHARPDHHRFVLVLFGQDDRTRSAAIFREALELYPDIVGVYSAGGGNAGVAHVMERQGLARSILWIGHELTENSRRWLTEGVMDIVLDQAPEIQARRAVDRTLHRIGFTDVEVGTDPVPFLTITRENM